MRGRWIHYPKQRAIAFLVFAILGITATIHDWYQDRRLPDAPESLTLNEAVERIRLKDSLWVELKDETVLQWDCRTDASGYTTFKGSKNYWMDVVVTDPAKSVVMVVNFSDPIPCNDLVASQPVLTGNFSRMDTEAYNRLNVEGRLDRYPRSATFVELYTNYTSADTGTDVVMIVFTVICLLVSLHGFYAGFILKQEPEMISEVRDSSLPRSFDRL